MAGNAKHSTGKYDHNQKKRELFSLLKNTPFERTKTYK